jgi:hypothetical protein
MDVPNGGLAVTGAATPARRAVATHRPSAHRLSHPPDRPLTAHSGLRLPARGQKAGNRTVYLYLAVLVPGDRAVPAGWLSRLAPPGGLAKTGS